jgi:ketosteroid isomerase-like protein
VAETNADRARRGFEAALRGDIDTIGELLDPEVKWHGGDPAATDSCHNRAEALDVMRRVLGRRGVGQLVDVIEARDKVVVIMRPNPDSNQPARLVANLATFRDGKVIEMVHYPNPDDAIAVARA